MRFKVCSGTRAGDAKMMYENQQNIEKMEHKYAGILRTKSLLKCLGDPILIKDKEVLTKLVCEINYHLEMAMLISRPPRSE